MVFIVMEFYALRPLQNGVRIFFMETSQIQQGKLLMRIKINGQMQDFNSMPNLEVLLSSQEKLPQYYVVAVNYDCISAQDYKTTFLNDGDEIEILSPMEGG